MIRNYLRNESNFLKFRAFSASLLLLFICGNLFAQSALSENQPRDNGAGVVQFIKTKPIVVEVTNEQGYVSCRNWKDKNGNILQTIKYCLPEHLNPFIASKVLERFQDKKIFGASEIYTNSGVYYYIVLEDRNNWYYITSDAEGNITLSKRYNKA